MKMNMKDKAVYELPLCLTREQVTHLQKEMFLFAKKKSFVFLFLCFTSSSLILLFKFLYIKNEIWYMTFISVSKSGDSSEESLISREN